MINISLALGSVTSKPYSTICCVIYSTCRHTSNWTVIVWLIDMEVAVLCKG